MKRLHVLLVMLCLFAAVTVRCPFFPKEGTSNNAASEFINMELISFLTHYPACLQDGAINFPDRYKNRPYIPECRANRVNDGLIFNHDTGEKIITASITGVTSLECRCFNSRENSLPENGWYSSEMLEPPNGYSAAFLFRHTYTQTQPYTIIPFSGFKPGDILYCVPSRCNEDMYQRLTIN